MFKSIINAATDFAVRIGIFQKSDTKEEPVAKVDSPKIIEEQPIKVVDVLIEKTVEEVKEPNEEVKEPNEEVKEPIKEKENQTIVELFEKDHEYNSDDEVVIHKQIYRTFTVKEPYNGPSQIVLSENEDLVKVHQNGQYIAAHMNSVEDYGTDDEDDFKVIYNIVVQV